MYNENIEHSNITIYLTHVEQREFYSIMIFLKIESSKCVFNMVTGEMV